MKLDRSKPYGEIWGIHYAKYTQDGKYFDAQGNELKPEPQKERKRETKRDS